MVRPGWGCEEAAGGVRVPGGGHGGRLSFQVSLLCFAATNSGEQLGAAFNLGQTDGDSVCGDCINIFNLDEGCVPFISFIFHIFWGVEEGGGGLPGRGWPRQKSARGEKKGRKKMLQAR